MFHAPARQRQTYCLPHGVGVSTCPIRGGGMANRVAEEGGMGGCKAEEHSSPLLCWGIPSTGCEVGTY